MHFFELGECNPTWKEEDLKIYTVYCIYILNLCRLKYGIKWNLLLEQPIIIAVNKFVKMHTVEIQNKEEEEQPKENVVTPNQDEIEEKMTKLCLNFDAVSDMWPSGT